MAIPTPTRRVQRVRHELRRRELHISRVAQLSPGFVALTFTGESLADFTSDSFDDHVKLLLADGSGTTMARDYTPRAFDRAARQLTIEFALHGHGVASEWARHAAVGDPLLVGGPRGSMIVPTDYDWHLLAGDDTAMPAIARRLQELPAGARVTVIVLAPEEDRRTFETQAAVDLQWVNTDDELVAAVQALRLPSGEGYAWAAGEAATMARVRNVLLQDKGHPKEAMRVAAYWKRGASAHHENLE